MDVCDSPIFKIYSGRMEIVGNKIKSIIKIIVFTLLVVIVTIEPSSTLSFAMGSKNMPEGKGLYFYSGRELLRFLRKIGHTEFDLKAIWDISRNSNGTELIFFNWDLNKALFVSCKGSVQEMDLPGTPTWSRRSVWFNNEHQVIAWSDKGKIHFKKGISGEEAFKAVNRGNLSGGYFTKHIPLPDNKNMTAGTAIYSIERPDVPIAKVMRIIGEQIFVKVDKVFLFGYYNARDEQEELYIFQRKGNKLIQTEKLMIQRPRKSPAPFNVLDLSPWDDEVLFIDGFDFPARSVWYTFNLKTQEMKRIGKRPFSGGWGFYLQCNIIKNFLDKHEK